ncbi:glyoxalase [Pullulanibacillus camelliae]|uniref:Glyoxalase n=1 Tax=Pullulanibacillus camelliae TaxID=1707096 RepID=A0A8J2VMD8_9BACL|nr:VOC family protein [Pullulanibacillus camelliae]GGE38247.1 glyoxalase [Pullulanibacillus camelliae]
MRHFFSEMLGMTEIAKPETLAKNGGVWFQCGEQQLHVGIQEPFKPATKAHPAFYIKNLDELRAHLIQNGIAITEDDRLPGATRFYVNDPFGNRIECLNWKS